MGCAGGRLAERWLDSGANTRYAYNADSTLSQVVNKTHTGAVISQHDYTYDGAGNRQTHTELIGGTTTPYKYGYDELNRLTEVRNAGTDALIEATAYDPLNNRTTKTDGATPVYYIYDAANQLKEARQGSISGAILASMLYDDNGSMTSKTEGSTTSMTYDALNRLSQVSKTGQSTQNYQYDDQGRRISKTVGGTTTNFLYSGPDIAAEYTSWTAPNAQYTHGPGMDDPILRAASTGAQYYHQDGLGSVVALTDQTGATLGTARFDAWGKVLAQTGAIPQYGYTGREPDETGLVYYRARYYDPAIGRFTSRDPIGLGGGINQYAYVANNPVNLIDPLGLKAIDPQTAQFVQANKSYVDDYTPGMGSGSQNLNAANALTSYLNKTAWTDLSYSNELSGQGYSLPASGELTLVADGSIVYERTGPNGECYIGSVCSQKRFLERQNEHDKATNRTNEYKILDENVSADQRRVIEEQHIREKGGPSNQGGTLENKRYEMNEQEFQKRGGTTPKPTSPRPVSPRTPGVRLPGLLMIPGLILDILEYQKMMNDPCPSGDCA